MNTLSTQTGGPTIHAQSLRTPLLLNAVFSGINGLVLFLASPAVATWLGPQTTWIYMYLGVGLLLFALLLSIVAVRPTPLSLLAITGADVVWVVSTTAALLVWRYDFTSVGWGLVLGTNAAILALAWFQQRSIRKAFQVPSGEPDEYQVCIGVDTPVAADAFWRVLADLGGIHRYMPELKSSALTVGEVGGVGCVRTCENVRGQVWSEKCEQWEEGKSFSVTFLTNAPGFPFPFSAMRGGWHVVPNAHGCRVEVWWRVIPHHPSTASVVLPLMAAGAQRRIAGVIARMTHAAQRRSISSGTPSVFPRLHAALC
jgi:Polyketide cyclase / dehydrase and lipid transport